MSDTLTPTPGAADADFRIDAPGEIMSWLRELLQSQARVQLSTPDGVAIHTVLRTLDAPTGTLTFEAPEDRAALAPVLACDELLASAFLDRIKLQFDISALVGIQGGNAGVLRAPVPSRLYRFQRRQAYRVQSTGQSYPAFLMPGVSPQRLRVVNVSAGGAGLHWPADVLPMPGTGDEINGTLELEREIAAPASLRVQHVNMGKADAPHYIGCAFASMAPTATRALQQFIDQAQKRERLLRRP